MTWTLFLLKNERHSILLALSKDLPIEDTSCLEHIAEATNGFTGADLKALLYNAQLLSVHRALSDNFEETTTDQPVEEPPSAEAEGNISFGSHLYVTDDQSIQHKVWQFQYESNKSDSPSHQSPHELQSVVRCSYI